MKTDLRILRGYLWNELADAGYETDRPYHRHSVEELKTLLAERKGVEVSELTLPATPLPADKSAKFVADGFEELDPHDRSGERRATTPTAHTIQERRPVPVLKGNPKAAEKPVAEGLPEGAIRADEHGRIWYTEEIGPDIAKNRRLRKRITKVVPEKVEVHQIDNGDYVETIEVIGESTRSLDAFVTMPTTQVGIFKDPKFPFLVFTYNGSVGFSYGDINDFYGGEEFVPNTIKKKFVGNMLAYDIKSVISTIERKARELQLARAFPTQNR